MGRAHDAPGSERSWGRQILLWLVQLAVSLVLYFCFAAKVDLPEAVLGVVVAAGAATGSHVVLGEHLERFAGHGGWMAQAWRLPKYAVTGTYEILSVLFRHLFTRHEAASLLLEVPFVSDDDQRDAGTRRALAVAYTTITPNFIVLGFDDARGRMVYHQIERSPIPEMTRRLGAQP